MPLPTPDYTETFDFLHRDELLAVVPVDPIPVSGTEPTTILHWETMKDGYKEQFHLTVEDYANTPTVGSAAEVDWLTDIDAAGAIPGFQYADFLNTVVGGSASGLDTTAASDPTHTVDLGGAAAGGTTTGLPSNTVATAGTQDVELTAPVVGGDSTGLPGGTAEVTEVDVPDASAFAATTVVGPPVDGSYWMLEAAPAPDPHYVWYNVLESQVQFVGMPVGGGTVGALPPPFVVGGGAPGAYFVIPVAAGHPAFPGFYVWYDVLDAGGNLDPGVFGPDVAFLVAYTGLKIDLLVADITFAAGPGSMIAETLANTHTPGLGITVDPLTLGEFAPSAPGPGPTDMTIIHTTPGPTGTPALDGITFGSGALGLGFTNPAAPVGDVLVAGVGPNADPAPGGTGISVTVDPSDLQADVGTATASAIDALSEFGATSPSEGIVEVVNAAGGPVTDAFDVTASLDSVTVTTQGAGSVVDLRFDIWTNGDPAQRINIDGSAIQTYTELLAEINGRITGATAALAGGGTAIRFTSDITGNDSKIQLNDFNLFNQLTVFDFIEDAVDGTSVLTYTASANINGTLYPLATTPAPGQTYADLIVDLDAIVGAVGFFSIIGGNLVLTGDPGTTYVELLDTTGLDLFQNLTLFVGFDNPVPATVPVEYTANFLVDGSTEINSVVLGVDGATFADVITELNADLGAFATAAIANGDIIVESGGVTGSGTTSVEFLGGSLWPALDGFFKFGIPRPEVETIAGATGFNFMEVNGPLNGDVLGIFWESFQVEHFGSPPFMSPNAGTSSDIAYHDPFTGDWKRLIDDTIIP